MNGMIIATKLRRLADDMQFDIDINNPAKRRTNTPQRRFYADLARVLGLRLSRTQAALRALADAHIAGTVPTELANIASKSEVYDRMGTLFDRSSAGYYDIGIDTGQPQWDDAAARALWRLIGIENSVEEGVLLKYEVQVIATLTVTRRVKVDAPGLDEAKRLAIEDARNRPDYWQVPGSQDYTVALLDPKELQGFDTDEIEVVE